MGECVNNKLTEDMNKNMTKLAGKDEEYNNEITEFQEILHYVEKKSKKYFFCRSALKFFFC